MIRCSHARACRKGGGLAYSMFDHWVAAGAHPTGQNDGDAVGLGTGERQR